MLDAALCVSLPWSARIGASAQQGPAGSGNVIRARPHSRVRADLGGGPGGQDGRGVGARVR